MSLEYNSQSKLLLAEGVPVDRNDFDATFFKGALLYDINDGRIYYSDGVTWVWLNESANTANLATISIYAYTANSAYNAANANFSLTANHAYNADIAFFANNADYANISYFAIEANTANVSNYSNLAFFAQTANTAEIANFAEFAFLANVANIAIYGETANVALYANLATFAEFAFGAENANTAELAYNALTAETAQQATFAFTANNAGFANTANNALEANNALNLNGKPEDQLNVNSAFFANNSNYLEQRQWANPGKIGSTTANTGVFTDVTVQGNLQVLGTFTFVNTAVLDVSNSFIVLNAGQATPINDIGVIFQRYATPNANNYNVAFAWDEQAQTVTLGATPNTHPQSNITFSQGWLSVDSSGRTTLQSLNVTQANVSYILSVAGLSANGSLGANGYSLFSNGTAIYWSDAAAGYTGSIGYTGSRGLQGYAGSRGLQGFVGSAGYTGSRGYDGSRGETGYVGSKGDLGYTGSQGLRGYDGSLGYAGSKGDIGYAGSRGYDGSIGYTGSIGPEGPQGPQGYAGSRGSDGSRG